MSPAFSLFRRISPLIATSGAAAQLDQPQAFALQTLTGTQPGAVAPMLTTTMGASATNALNIPTVNAATNQGAAEGATERNAERTAEDTAEGATEEEAAEGFRTCWGCCGPTTVPGPADPTIPAGVRVVEYFKSGYNSAAAGANASNGLPANISAIPTTRQEV